MTTTIKSALPILALAVFVFWPGSSFARQNDFDWSKWQKILQANVSAGTKDRVKINGVDYKALREKRTTNGFDALVKKLYSFDPSGLKTKGKIAFWLNVYNLSAIKMVLDHPGIKSINDAVGKPGSVWKTKIITVGKKQYSLDEIENSILRPLGDPRIHFAIVCASVSCPNIRPEPYNAQKLGAQLDDQARKMLSNHGKGMMVLPGKKRIVLSKIFEWFAKDFGGQKGVFDFIQRNAKGLPSGWREFELRYMDYNWDLNEL